MKTAEADNVNSTIQPSTNFGGIRANFAVVNGSHSLASGSFRDDPGDRDNVPKAVVCVTQHQTSARL